MQNSPGLMLLLDGEQAYYSSLFVTKKVQRRTLASGTYPDAPTPNPCHCGVRCALPASVVRPARFAHSATPLPTHVASTFPPRCRGGQSGTLSVAGRRASDHAGSFAPSPRTVYNGEMELAAGLYVGHGLP